MHQSSIESQEIARFAEAVDRMNRNLDSWSHFFERLTQAETMRFLALGQSTDITSATVRSIIAARRLRDEHFWPSMNESAWDLMLEIFADCLIGQRRNVAELSTAVALDEENVVHWVDWLATQGMVHRRSEGSVSTKELVSLTDEGTDRMHAYLMESLQLSPWVV